MRAAVVCMLVACGGGSTPPPARSGPAAQVVAPAAGADDAIVAEVAGRPVWGSCVAAQAAARHLDRAAALRECVDFELLAQAADARGLASDREVGEATRAALVNRLVELDFESRYRSPGDAPSQIDRVIQQNPLLMNRPERRASTYVRFETCGRATCIKCRPGDQVEPLCKGVVKPPSPELDAEAHALADKVYAELGQATGLFPENLIDTATRLSAGAKVVLAHDDFKPEMRSGIVQPYRDALFGIPEVGRIAAPVHTTWGWDVILWSDVQPAKMYTRDEAAVEIFPELRRQLFLRWCDKLEKDHAVAKDYDQLEEAPPS
jgi:hypothetical protein